ncbi:MAG TPA: osmoprotectant transporter permease [Saprospiraceae bacterium]|nr:osmoprotectant transporter permease [Saprospiraceae bacterium]
MNTLFWMGWYLVLGATLVAFYFFFAGLADGSVSQSNMGIWMWLVLGLPALLGITWWLKGQDRIKTALGLLSIPSLLVIAYLIFIAAVLFGNNKWN